MEELRISWTKIREHQECGMKGYLKSSGKRSPAADIRNYFHGTLVDQCMRRWLDQDDPQPGQMAAMVDAVLEESERTARETGDGIVRWRGLHDKAELAVWAKDFVTDLEARLYRLAVPYEYQPALRFGPFDGQKSVPLRIPYLDGTPATVQLVGEIDLLVRDGDRLMVWDLKATKDDNYWRKTMAQLIFYEIAVKVMTGHWPVQSGLISPSTREPEMSWTFSMEQRMEMFSHITRYASDMWRGHHPFKQGVAGCDRCEVNHACPRFKVPTESGRGRVG